MLVRHQLKKIDQRRSTRCPRSFRNLIGLQLVAAALIREEEDDIVVRRHHDVGHCVIFNCLHALDAPSAAVLHTEIVHGHAFDIS